MSLRMFFSADMVGTVKLASLGRMHTTSLLGTRELGSHKVGLRLLNYKCICVAAATFQKACNYEVRCSVFKDLYN